MGRDSHGGADVGVRAAQGREGARHLGRILSGTIAAGSTPASGVLVADEWVKKGSCDKGRPAFLKGKKIAENVDMRHLRREATHVHVSRGASPGPNAEAIRLDACQRYLRTRRPRRGGKRVSLPFLPIDAHGHDMARGA